MMARNSTSYFGVNDVTQGESLAIFERQRQPSRCHEPEIPKVLGIEFRRGVNAVFFDEHAKLRALIRDYGVS